MKKQNLLWLVPLLLIGILAACSAAEPEPQQQAVDSDARPTPTFDPNQPTPTPEALPPVPNDAGPGLPTPFPPTPTLDVNQPTPTPEARMPEGEDELSEDLLQRQATTPYLVEIETADQVIMQATYYPVPGESVPALLLLHMWGGDRQVWRTLAANAQEQGMASLAVDLHGHGSTSGKRDARVMQQDITAALDWLTSKTSPSAVAVVGASVSANLALEVSGGRADVAAVALISPLPDEAMEEIALTTPLRQVEERPLFVAIAAEDTNSASVTAFQSRSTTTVKTYDGATHGTNLLQTSNQLQADLLTWLKDVLS